MHRFRNSDFAFSTPSVTSLSAMSSAVMPSVTTNLSVVRGGLPSHITSTICSMSMLRESIYVPALSLLDFPVKSTYILNTVLLVISPGDTMFPSSSTPPASYSFLAMLLAPEPELIVISTGVASFISTGENSFALTLLNANVNTNTHMPALIRNMSSGLTARHIFPAVLFPFPLCRFLSFVPRSTLRYLSV